MTHKLTADCRQAFLSPAFFLSVTGTALILFLSGFDRIISAFRTIQTGSLLEYGFHGNLVLSVLSSDTAFMIFPIAAALPFTASYVDDIKSGFIKMYLPRMGCLQYIGGKLLACALSGGSVFLLGGLLCCGISSLCFLPLEVAPETGMEYSSCLLQLFQQSGLYFCSGAFWSLTGLTFSAVTGSRYMAYASPFIFYYVLIILCERYFPSLYILHPEEWISPSGNWPLGKWSAALWLLELSGLCSLAFLIIAKKRLTEL